MRLLALLAVVTLAGCGGSTPGAPSPVASSTPVPTVPPSPAATPTPAPQATPTPAPPPPAGEVVTVRRASIRGARGHAASGTARIVRDGAQYRLELGGDFRIDSGNNDIYLARDGDSIGASDLNLGNLRSTTGAQSYTLPDAAERYGHVVIWCRPFRVTIGTGELQ